jgi:D-inositol-3-phosphate glycosyltransferase
MSVFIREISNELSKRGCSVDIYTRAGEKDHYPIVELYENVRLIHLDIGNNGYASKLELRRHLRDFFLALEEFREAENLCYDLIHSHYWLSGKLGGWAQRSWDLPHVVTFHTLGALRNLKGFQEKAPEIRVHYERELAEVCHRIIVATHEEKENLIRYYGAPEEKIGIVPCGVNLELFRPSDKQEARRRLGFGLDENIILYVGRLEPLKGIHELLKGMSYLNHHSNLRLVVIGGDGEGSPELQHLKDLAHEYQIADRVHFAGRMPQSRLPLFYSAVDLLVIPSHYESFGLVGLESLACGTPVVSTPVGAMESILVEGKTGKTVVSAGARSLAEGIDAFLSHSPGSRWSPLDVRASIERFDWSTVTSAMIHEYGLAMDFMDSVGLDAPPAEASII